MTTIAPQSHTPVLINHGQTPAFTPTQTSTNKPRNERAPLSILDFINGDGGDQTQTTLVDDGNLNVKLSVKNSLDPNSLKTRKTSETLIIETGDRSDTIHISHSANGGLNVEVNGKSYTFNVKHEKDGEPTRLHIRSHGGDDRIKIDADVMLPITVEAGDGNDHVQAGGGPTRLYGGKGNDHLQLGSGLGYAEGNDGDDTMIGGTGNVVMYGNNGEDCMYAGAGYANKKSHLDGGSGADHLYAGSGHTVLNGGLGDDVLIGHDRTTFYSGKGRDTLWTNNPKDLIYAKNSDQLRGTLGANLIPVTPNEAGKEGFSILGTEDEKQRIEDDLELLRSSPTGQKMLSEMDELARRNNAPVTLRIGSKSQYSADSGDSYIRNGIRGRSVTDGTIQYDPTNNRHPLQYEGSPIVGLFHEMAHSYNAGSGSNFSGTTKEQVGNKPAVDAPNVERQAVGLPTNETPFDFDNDPLTPPTSTNPAPLTENGLREEMGVTRRDSVSPE